MKCSCSRPEETIKGDVPVFFSRVERCLERFGLRKQELTLVICIRVNQLAC
jgi:hypothetical protein